MGENILEKILSVYNCDSKTLEIQKKQTLHRLKLIDFWGIKEGDRVLEIGCGQGDTTAALAFTVGEKGYVHGIDIADEYYGSPETVGSARKRILSSEIGGRTDITLECDILNDDIVFEENSFDCAVLSHCLWYFADYEVLERVLKKLGKYAKRVCIAEWNPCITDVSQLAHLHAARIQSVCESFRDNGDSNIRNMFYPMDIKTAVVAAGFKIEKTGSVYSEDVHDGRWEIDMTVSAYPRIIRKLDNMPERLKELLLSEIHTLREPQDIKPMSSYVLTASIDG